MYHVTYVTVHSTIAKRKAEWNKILQIISKYESAHHVSELVVIKPGNNRIARKNVGLNFNDPFIMNSDEKADFIIVFKNGKLHVK